MKGEKKQLQVTGLSGPLSVGEDGEKWDYGSAGSVCPGFRLQHGWHEHGGGTCNQH